MPTRSSRTRPVPATPLVLLLAIVLGAAFSPVARATGYTWSNAGGGNWSNAANWSPAGVPATGDGVTLPALGAGYAVTLDASASLSALTVAAGATLQFAGGDTLALTGHYLHNDGSIQVGSTLANALFVADSTHFSGSGEVVLAGLARLSNPFPRPQGLNAHAWILNEAGHTIRGAGEILTPILNHGTVSADGSGGGSWSQLERLTNYGTVRTSGSATFHVSGAFQSVGGQIVGNNGTFTTLLDPNSNSGFPIDNLQGGSFVADGGDLYVSGGTIAGGTIRQTGGSGAVHFNSLGNPSDIVVAAGADLVLDGQYDWTVDGSALENHGTVHVRGLLNVYCSATGTCNLTGDGTTRLEGGTIAMGALGGALYVAPGATLSGCGTITANVINDGTISADCASGDLAIRDVTLTNRGTFRVLHGTLWAQGARLQIVNSGTMSLAGVNYIDKGATVRNVGSGSIVSTGSTVLGLNSPGATVIGGSLAGSGTFGNAGQVTLQGVTLAPGGTFVLYGGTLTAPLGLTVDGALRGSGAVAGSVTNAGDVTPDIGATGITVQGDYHQLASGRLNLGLSGYDADQFAHLNVTGNAQLDGAVVVTATAGFTPTPGRDFGVMAAGTRAGVFASVEPGTGMMMLPLYGTSGVTLQATGPAGVGAPSLPAALRFYGHDRGFDLALPQAATVDVRAYDVAGRQVAVLASGALVAGVHRMDLGAASLPSGLYFARAAIVSAAGVRETRKATTIVVR